MTHEHRCQGQTLRHSHPDGTTPHGYFGHAEDPQPETIQPGEVYVHPDGAEVRLAAEQARPVRFVSIVDGAGLVIHTFIDGGGPLRPGTYPATVEVRQVTREQQRQAGHGDS